MTSFGLFAFCTTLKKLNTLMANLLLVQYIQISAASEWALHARPTTCKQLTSTCTGELVYRTSSN